MNKIKLIVSFMLVTSLTLAGCSKGKEEDTTAAKGGVVDNSITAPSGDYDEEYDNSGTPSDNTDSDVTIGDVAESEPNLEFKEVVAAREGVDVKFVYSRFVSHLFPSDAEYYLASYNAENGGTMWLDLKFEVTNNTEEAIICADEISGAYTFNSIKEKLVLYKEYNGYTNRTEGNDAVINPGECAVIHLTKQYGNLDMRVESITVEYNVCGGEYSVDVVNGAAPVLADFKAELKIGETSTVDGLELTVVTCTTDTAVITVKNTSENAFSGETFAYILVDDNIVPATVTYANGLGSIATGEETQITVSVDPASVTETANTAIRLNLGTSFFSVNPAEVTE